MTDMKSRVFIRLFPGTTTTISGGKEITVPVGTEIQKILTHSVIQAGSYPIIAARVNNEITSLSYQVQVNSTIEFITLDSREGTNIYRRSLSFLLQLASKELFPERRLIIGHSLGKGYFYYFENSDNVAEQDIKDLIKRMNEIVAQDIPIIRKVISYMDAVKYFQGSNQPDTLQLLAYRNDSKIPVYECGDFIDIAHGPLVPGTGVLKIFTIMNYPPGFILRYFSFGKPDKIEEFKKNPILFSIYREYKQWGKILNVHCVGALNDLHRTGKIKEFIQINEALQYKKISEIADKIVRKGPQTRLVLIAGPSSSGKTTLAKKLAIQLKVYGFQPIQLSIDNYFLPRDRTPVDEDGNFDFENINAIDVPLFNEHLSALLNGKQVEIPSYSFVHGIRKPESSLLQLESNGILICEGIHFLNDQLSTQVPRNHKFKIYVSALTQLNLDDHNRISTTDNRLIRRMVRDHQFRGYSALETLRMWHSVRRGENKNIFPFQNSADTAFNSALDYELAVLKVYAEPLLKTVKPDVKEYNEAKRLLRFLTNFMPVTSSWVPSASILREFIGESSFKYT